MENQDKLYEQFKSAAEKSEAQGFARMEAVWNRVEEKLDHKKQRKVAAWWKYTGMAAVLALFIAVGTFFFRNESPAVNPQNIPEHNVTVIDTQKVKRTFKPAKENVIEKEAVVVNDRPNMQKGGIAEGDSIHFTATTKKARVGRDGDNARSGRAAEETAITPRYYTMHTEAKEAGKAADTKAYASTSAASGDISFSGTIVDSQGMPIPGVTIYDSTGKNVQTDFDGKYTINIKEGDKLTASYIGMQNKSVLGYMGNNNHTIQLAEDAVELESVVTNSYRNTASVSSNAGITVVPSKKFDEKVNKGFSPSVQGTVADIDEGKVKDRVYHERSDKGEFRVSGELTADKSADDKSKLGVPIASVASKTVEGRPNASFIQTLQGQVPGLNIAAGSGQPGANSTVILRGYGSVNGNIDPLYVIDGVPLNADNFRAINPNDIISVSVLKDAGATAIYGNRGANGVIIVTTKKAKPLTKRQLRKQERINKKLEEQRLKEQTKSGNIREGEEIAPLSDIIISGDEPFRKVQVDTEEYEAFEENKFENPATTPLSTFSIDVDNASYTNVRRFLNNGQIVPKDAVRVEEMINFFKYEYPQPINKDPFSINTEYSDAPWNPKHKLLKIGLQGKIIPDEILPASNFVFLIDVSGSMNEPNKLPLLKESMKLLVKQMRPQDRIAIVVYAGAAGMVLPSTGGANKNTIIAALDNLSAGGSTAGGAGIELAYKTAQENFIRNGNNRVILATDGDFNVGASSNTDMQTLIEEKRRSGVFLTCLGYGMGNYKDSKLETLADKGNGNYAYIDNMQEADRFLQKEFKGSMFAIAKDVKIQIEFNPKHVRSYRLIGYENRKLRDEDFANDAIDAGELGSGHTVTALYEIIPEGVESDLYVPSTDLKYSQPAATTGNYNDELATIKFRHKKPDEDKSTETVKVIPNVETPLSQASGDFKFAAVVAWFGLKLRDSKLIPNKTSEDIMALAKEGLLNDTDGYRAEFVRLVERVE